MDSREKIYLSEEEVAKGEEMVGQLRASFVKLYGMLAQGDLLRFCKEEEETAFSVYMLGQFAMMMPGKDVNREAMVDRKNLNRVYKAVKETLMGETAKKIITKADDVAAKEILYWGLYAGKMGVDDGSMPTGMGNWDIIGPEPKAND